MRPDRLARGEGSRALAPCQPETALGPPATVTPRSRSLMLALASSTASDSRGSARRLIGRAQSPRQTCRGCRRGRTERPRRRRPPINNTAIIGQLIGTTVTVLPLSLSERCTDSQVRVAAGPGPLSDVRGDPGYNNKDREQARALHPERPETWPSMRPLSLRRFCRTSIAP